MLSDQQLTNLVNQANRIIRASNLQNGPNSPVTAAVFNYLLSKEPNA